jgi:addiction module HigA family antidote
MAKIKMGMKPAHPGAFVQDEILGHYGLSVTRGAEILGVRRATLSDLVNEKTALSPEMAMRIEMAFGLNADGMLRIQAAWDAHEARRHAATLSVKRYNPEAA